MNVSKKISAILGFAIMLNLLVSCSSDDDKTTVPTEETTELYKGTFVSSSHPTNGLASINLSKTELSLTSFMTDNGPNLDIYLVSNLSNVNGDFIDLGNIKGVNGSYTYNLPNNVDYSVYKYVVVWCTDFSVNFGYATLAQE